MIGKRKVEAERWFRQAYYDLEAARWNIKGGFNDAACFLAQQAGEKALKSILYYLGARRTALLTHSLVEMIRETGKHVTFLALHLFDQLRELHHLGEKERSWLSAASLLHDIGWVEGWRGHHKTSLRIILETPMLPFSSKERLIVGSIARYHRKGLPRRSHDNLAALGKADQSIVLKLAAFLRLANSLDLDHRSLVRNVNCKVSEDQITVYCEVDQPAEDELMAAVERADLLAKVFHKKISLQMQPPPPN